MIRIFLMVLALTVTGQAGAEEIRLKENKNNMTLNANLEKADNWPAGPVILITHGTLSHNGSEIIASLQELLGENGISSLAINLGLGIDDRHGSYDCQKPHRHRHEDAIAEIGQWLDWLKKQGSKQVVLMGHSRGGNQAAWFAAEHDDPVITKVVLIAPQTWSPEHAATDYEKRYGKPLAPLLAKAQSLVKAGQGETMIKPVDFIYCKDTAASADAFVSYYAPDLRKDTPTLLPRISKPVLIFAGTEDRIVEGLDKKLQPLVKSGKIELDIIDGADHFFRDLYLEDIVDRTVEFVAK